MTRRWFGGRGNNNDERERMATDWAGHTAPVRAVPEIGGPDHDDFVGQAREHEQRQITEAQDALNRALNEFSDRFRALAWRIDRIGSPEQFAELDTLHALWVAVMGCKAMLAAQQRDHDLGRTEARHDPRDQRMRNFLAGRPLDAPAAIRDCLNCQGTGQRSWPQRGGLPPQITPCGACDGSGVIRPGKSE